MLATAILIYHIFRKAIYPNVAFEAEGIEFVMMYSKEYKAIGIIVLSKSTRDEQRVAFT